MNTTSSLKYKKCVNNMDELEGQSYRTGKCICLWKECHSWTAFFASKKHHLGSMVKIRGNVNDSQQCPRTSLSKKEKFRKIVLRNLNRCDLNKSQTQALFVAKHHFPHKYMDKRPSKRLSTPISELQAESLGIPTKRNRDVANVAYTVVGGTSYYFLAPCVPRKIVSDLVKQLSNQ